MERFIAAPDAFTDREVRITGDEYHHLKNVLRLKEGERVEVFDGAGKGFRGRIVTLEGKEARVALDEPVTQSRDSALEICLAQGIAKGEKMEWVVQKATELGAASILPLELSRCVVRLEDDKKRRDRQLRWQKVAAEAAKQCGRLQIPEVFYPEGLDAFLRRIQAEDLLVIPWEEGGKPIRDWIATMDNPAEAGGNTSRRIFMMIGPEGGMTAQEVEAGRCAGGHILTLGPRILRTETAGLAMLSVLQYVWGDMGGSIRLG